MRQDLLVLLSDPDQVPEVLAYRDAHPGAQIVCVDFWAEQELIRTGIPFISMRTLLAPEHDEEAWWVLAQDVAREWYRLPALQFFEHEGIRIGEALEPMFESYLAFLFQYARMYTVLKRAYPGARVYIPAPVMDDEPTASCLISFERSAYVDAARLVGLAREGEIPHMLPSRQLFPRSALKSIAIYAYNALMSLVPRRPLKIYASEYWSHIAPVLERMADAELVLMEVSELKHIPWRQLLAHRVRVRHPLDVIGGRTKRTAQARAEEYRNHWKTAKSEVAAYLARMQNELDWNPVFDVYDYLITYSSRVIADIDALERIMREEKPGVVLERASIGGRQHHFFLMARVAAQFHIPSVELQHAGAVLDPRSIHSRLETSYLASYGEFEREQYAKNGYAPERIIPVGSPRFEHYREAADAGVSSREREETLRMIGLEASQPVLMIAVPAELSFLSPFAFFSYDIAAFFEEMQKMRRALPGVQLLFKFRRQRLKEQHRAYLHTLFPEGGIAITDGNPGPLMHASDIVISGNSAMMYEAMLAKKPLVLYPWKEWDYHLALYGAVAPQARSGAELAGIIEKLLSDTRYTQDVSKREQAFIDRHAFDGKSAEHMSALLRRIKPI